MSSLRWLYLIPRLSRILVKLSSLTSGTPKNANLMTKVWETDMTRTVVQK
jgi:hypothetical protein